MDESERAPEACGEQTLAVPGGTRARTDEWALVLASQGVASEIRPTEHGYALGVAERDAVRAREIIETYRRENAAAAHPPLDDAASDASDEPGLAGVVVALGLIVLHGLAARPDLHDVVYEHGSANARAILSGEWWRTVSALFLHADLGHVIGNALFGVYFVTAVTRALGVGLGLLLVLASGALGNALNAVGHAGTHDSIGASTAVFGAIGILAGTALARRNRSGLRGARLLLPVGAGLGLLAMLGTTGARVDVFAHLYGLLTGGLLGIGATLGLVQRPGRRAQLALAGATIAVVAGAFARVLAR